MRNFTKYILLLKLYCKRSLKAVQEFLIQKEHIIFFTDFYVKFERLTLLIHYLYFLRLMRNAKLRCCTFVKLIEVPCF